MGVMHFQDAVAASKHFQGCCSVESWSFRDCIPKLELGNEKEPSGSHAGAWERANLRAGAQAPAWVPLSWKLELPGYAPKRSLGARGK